MRKTRKRPKYDIQKKNKIVQEYLQRKYSYYALTRKYDIARGTLSVWVRQYKKHGTCVDGRGKATKKEAPGKGRKKVYEVPLEELSKEQLIRKVKMYEDIKKSIAYLIEEQQN